MSAPDSAVLLEPSTSVAGELPPAEKRRHLVELVVRSVPSRTSQRVYRMGVEQFLDWWGAEAGVEPFGRSLVGRFRVALEARRLAPRTTNLRLATVRKLAEEAAAEGLLPQGKVAEIRSVKGALVLG